MTELQEALAPYLSLPKLRRLVADDATQLHAALRQPEPPAEVAQLLQALAAVLELPQRTQITSPADVAALLLVEMSTLEQEHLRVVLLNTKNHVLGIETIYVGTINSSAVRVCEVFRLAIRRNAAALIIVHNHPSGDPTPSPEDVTVTRQLVAAGRLLDLEVLDHLVIGQGRWTSLRERGVGFEGACHYKAFTYRLYPTKTQQRSLEATLETCRRWYNTCLEERKTAYAERNESVGKFAQLAKVKDLKTTNPYAASVHSHVLQVVVADLDKTFQHFFQRVKAGEKAGYPRFKGRNRFSSFGFKEYGNGFKIDGRRLKLFGVGRVPVRWHRPIEGKIKTVRVVRKANAWYACFSCEVEVRPLPVTGQAVGIEVGIASLLTTSDGEHITNPRWYRVEQRTLRVLQRRVARRRKGGKNRRKAITQLQRQHARIANRRKDYLNKIVYGLIQQYDRIALEDLRITNMVKNRHLAKSIMDAGWGYLTMRLRAKAEEAGRVVLLVDPAYTSKTCSACGREFAGLTLKDRWVTCACGLSLDRDHNAAINVLKRAGHVRWGISSSVDGLPQEAAPL